MTPGKMECYGATDVGRRREINEDQFLIADLNRSLRLFQSSLDIDQQTRLFSNSQGKILLVADGMGGHDAGERASQLVVDSIMEYMLNMMPWVASASNDEVHVAFEAALYHCQHILQQEGAAIPQHRGMGTTLTMAYLVWPRMYVAHVGDSRCYLFRDGRLQQLTRDHTMGALYRESVEGATRGSAGDNILWNVLCADQNELSPEVCLVQLQLHDRVLLCTDGLYKHVTDDRISELLGSQMDAEELCGRLIGEANAAGGTDNITVVAARFLDNQEVLQETLEAAEPASGERETVEFRPSAKA